MKQKKPKKPLEPEDKEDEEEEESPTKEQEQDMLKDLKDLTSGRGFIQIGDLILGSHKGGLSACSTMAVELLSNKRVKSYLGFYDRKKVLGSLPSYID